MASFSNQFHATADELIQFTKDIIDKFDVHVVAVHHPFRAEALLKDNASTVLSQSSVRRIVFTESPPVLLAKSEGEFLDKNKGSLVLDIGKVIGHTLEESWLTTMNASPVWKKANALLKSRTTAGAIGTHDTTGHSTFYRDRRLTAGAIALSEQGTELRQYAQLPIVFRPSDKAAKSK